jgi:hypothetical protein
MQGYHGRRGRRVPRSLPASLDSLGSLGDTPATAPIATAATDTSSSTISSTAAPAAAPAAFSLRDAMNSDNVSIAAAIALAYHGYKRTDSILWALFYGLAGREFPIEAVPVALAQGFGQKKKCP